MSLLKRFRNHIPLQFVGIGLTFFQAMCWSLMLAVILWHLSVHGLVWMLYAVLTLLDFLAWLSYSALDIDGDGAEGVR